MTKRLLVLAMTALACVATGASADEKRGTTADGKPYFEATEKVTVQSTVIGLDKTTRLVTLRGEAGDTLSLTAGPEVKNFAQIRVGDVVKTSYTERLTITVEAAGAPEVVTETTTGAAKQGEMPKGSVTERTQYKAQITAIDLKNGTATLKGHDGDEFIVSPLYPENLKKVKVGELVVFTTTETVAVSVEKVATKKKAK